MTTYEGFELLEREPLGELDKTDTFKRQRFSMDHGYGKKWSRSKTSKPKLEVAYTWQCRSHSDIAALKTWLLARKGMAVPFWFPTWRMDIQLAADVAPTDTTITIARSKYLEMMFPAKARRRLVFITPARVLYCRKVTAVSVTDAVETLYLDSALGITFSKEWMLSFLLLVRLSDDAATISYMTDAKAVCNLNFTEIPQEVP